MPRQWTCPDSLTAPGTGAEGRDCRPAEGLHKDVGKPRRLPGVDTGVELAL